MAKKPAADDHDMHLFHKEMESVSRIKQPNRVQHAQSPKLPTKKKHYIPEGSVDTGLDEASTPPVTANEPLTFHRPGVQSNYLRKLKRGQIHCEASIDLHRLTVIESNQLVSNFLTDSQSQGFRCVKIIHGKGHMGKNDKPILKNKLNRWLRAHHFVLAFCSALPADGGTGAVYILLKRS